MNSSGGRPDSRLATARALRGLADIPPVSRATRSAGKSRRPTYQEGEPSRPSGDMIAAIHAARKKREEKERQRQAALEAGQRQASRMDSADMDEVEDASAHSSTQPPGTSTEPTPKEHQTTFLNTKLQWDGYVPPRPRRVQFWLPRQREVFDIYQSRVTQYVVAAVIVANFIFNCAEKEWDPYDEQNYPRLWVWGEFAFNSLFLIELMVNFYSLAFKFWRFNFAWNTFDLVVVSIGCVTMAEALTYPDTFLPGQLTLIRNLRAFRIFRLFKRVKSLNKIIVALFKAVPGVVNAFVIMMIVMCIYAILGDMKVLVACAIIGARTLLDGGESRCRLLLDDGRLRRVCDARRTSCSPYPPHCVSSHLRL